MRRGRRPRDEQGHEATCMLTGWGRGFADQAYDQCPLSQQAQQREAPLRGGGPCPTSQSSCASHLACVLYMSSPASCYFLRQPIAISTATQTPTFHKQSQKEAPRPWFLGRAIGGDLQPLWTLLLRYSQNGKWQGSGPGEKEGNSCGRITSALLCQPRSGQVGKGNNEI